jgi:peptide/nickel transport system permease protein
MLGFVVRRLASSLLVLLLSSMIVFALVANSGNPLADLQGRQPPAPAAVIEARSRALHLDKPIIQRYGIWLGDFVQGDMGRSIDGREVKPLLLKRIQVTARMVIGAMLLALFLAITVGVFSAVRQYSIGDYAATFSGFLFLSMPVFWLALLLKLFLALKVNNLLGGTYVYTIGEQTPNLTGGFFSRMGNYAGHLVLPTVALALLYYAGWSRFQRSSMLDVLNSDYIRLARAKGLSPGRVMIRHALRNALIPITTVVAIDFAGILGGAIITEQVFAWQGMGQLFLDGLQSQDLNIVLAWLMVAAFMVVVFNLLADVLYGVLDPRIRYA